MAYKVVCIYLLGADPVAVVVFEITLNATATFNHSNKEELGLIKLLLLPFKNGN